MSNIIFRCWDTKLAKYAPGPSNDDIEWSTTIPFKYYESNKSVILQQCTGKQDRFGKWIFEGDILLLIEEWDDGNTETKVKLFIDEDLLWTVEDLQDGPRRWGSNCFSEYCNGSDHLIVIGNIYEGYKSNPEIREMFIKEDLENQKIWEEMENEERSIK